MQHFENDFAEFWIEDGILFFVYKPGVVINLQAAKKIVSDRLKFQDGTVFPVFCDIRGIRDSDKPSRNYLAKEGSALIKAVSIIVESPVTRSMSNFYLRMNRPLVPTRIFTDRNLALDFLESFKSSR